MTPRRRIIPIFVPHAGCPNMCVFCDQKRISGSLLPASGKMVTDVLSTLADGAGYELAFYGGSFTAIPAEKQEELLGAAQGAFDRGAISSIRVSTRPDAVDAAALDRLRRCHVQAVELGAQSMSDSVLAASGRGHTAEDTRRAAAMVKEAGFRLILQMMTGLPGSDPGSDIQTAKELIALSPDGVRIYPTVVIRGTVLEEMWREGRYKEHTVEDAVKLCADILPLFENAGIPVIRLGLNPSEELSGGAAAAGAYHPALGELVRSELLRRRAEELLAGTLPGSCARLLVPERMVSAVTGQHRRNILALKEAFSLKKLTVSAADVADIQLQILPE